VTVIASANNTDLLREKRIDPSLDSEASPVRPRRKESLSARTEFWIKTVHAKSVLQGRGCLR
jgi:hypothetical protein